MNRGEREDNRPRLGRNEIRWDLGPYLGFSKCRIWAAHVVSWNDFRMRSHEPHQAHEKPHHI